MRLVVDSNVLMTAFWPRSTFSELARRPDMRLYAPVYALDEIRKHGAEIRQKTKTTAHQFARVLESLEGLVRFFEKNEYSSGLRGMEKELRQLDAKDREPICEDIDFLTLAHERRCPLWSNDGLLKKQKAVVVLSTMELILLLKSEPKF